MKAIYLAHPLSAPTREGIEANRARASRWVSWVARHFRYAVIADWIVMTGVLEETPENRDLGLKCDCELVRRADEFWMVGGRLSSGMSVERKAADDAGKPVVDLLFLGEEPPEQIDASMLALLVAKLGQKHPAAKDGKVTVSV